MDEILIGEKRYISSKQAAKETGYAKDYIGQLCREGRVPARLVGRSWYVLESAIRDHRFGDSKDDSQKESAPASAASIASTWDAPRYAASEEAEILPQIRAQESEPAVKHEETERMQDTWQAWFAKFEPAATEEKEPVAPIEAPLKEEEDAPEQEETQIPIHTVYQIQQHTAPEEIISPPVAADTDAEWRHIDTILPKRAAGRWVIQVAGMLCAVFAVLVAILGTGYFDKYIASDSRVMLLAGVEIYNK